MCDSSGTPASPGTWAWSMTVTSCVTAGTASWWVVVYSAGCAGVPQGTVVSAQAVAPVTLSPAPASTRAVAARPTGEIERVVICVSQGAPSRPRSGSARSVGVAVRVTLTVKRE